MLNRKLSQRTKIIAQQQQQPQLQLQQQQQQQSQDEEMTNALGCQDNSTNVSSVTYSTQQQQQIQKVASGKLMKMPSFPLLVSEVNIQQQQQQLQLQQKHNSTATISSNHNYSLQPATAIITSQASQSVGNKIYLTTSSSGGAQTNFTITNTGELQSTAQKLQQANQTNLKVNFVSASNNNQQQQQLLGQQQTVILNKGNVQQQLLPQQILQQQTKLKRERILNIIGATTNAQQLPADTSVGNSSQVVATSSGQQTAIASDTNNKRVLYTSLLNMKPLPKINAGQMQVQIGPQGMAHVLRGRIGNNQTIFANMRPVPVATSVALSGNNNNHNSSNNSSSAMLQVVAATNNNNGGNNTLNSNNSSSMSSSSSSSSTSSVSSVMNSNNNNSDGSSSSSLQLNDLINTSSSTTASNIVSSIDLKTIANSLDNSSANTGTMNNNATSNLAGNCSSSMTTTGAVAAQNANSVQTNNTTTINR